jgi:hypothetical protein
VRIDGETLAHALRGEPPQHPTASEMVHTLTHEAVPAAKGCALFPAPGAEPEAAPEWKPLGCCIDKYSHGDKSFEVWHSVCGKEKERAYHSRAQAFALLFIDGASFIDTEARVARWENDAC